MSIRFTMDPQIDIETTQTDTVSTSSHSHETVITDTATHASTNENWESIPSIKTVSSENIVESSIEKNKTNNIKTTKICTMLQTDESFEINTIDAPLPEILDFNSWQKIAWRKNLANTRKEIRTKYPAIFSIYRERSKSLEEDYEKEAIELNIDFNWQELDILHLAELNVLTLPIPLILCLNHVLPLYEELYKIISAIHINNILAVMAWNEGYWLSNFSGHEIVYSTNKNCFQQLREESIEAASKKSKEYCFSMKNNYIKFCLEYNYQELLQCEKKLTDAKNIFIDLFDDCKRWSEPSDGLLLNVQKDAEQKANCYFKLIQQRAISTAHHHCQPIITQFLKLTQHPTAINIPRDGGPGFNIMVTDENPSIAIGASILKKNKNVPIFEGFIKNSGINEHRLAAATKLYAVTAKTPQVNFEAYKSTSHSSRSSTQAAIYNLIDNNRIDPFVIRGIGKLIATSSAPIGPSHQKTISSIVSNPVPLIHTSSAKVVASTSSTRTSKESFVELFIPKVVYFCYKSKVAQPEGSTSLPKCFAGIDCEHHINCKYGHTSKEVESFMDNCRGMAGNNNARSDSKMQINETPSTPQKYNNSSSTLLETPSNLNPAPITTPISGELIAELVGSIGRLIDTQQHTQPSAQRYRHESNAKRPLSPSAATQKNDFRERDNQRTSFNYTPQTRESRVEKYPRTTANRNDISRSYQQNNVQVSNYVEKLPNPLLNTKLLNTLDNTTSLGTTIQNQFWLSRSTGERNTSEMEPPKKRSRRRKRMATASIPLVPSSLPSANIKNQGVNIITKANISRDEMLVLTLGLKYVVPARITDDDDNKIIESLNNFHRKIRIKKYFLENGDDNSTSTKNPKHMLHQKVKKRNFFQPPTAGIYLEHYISVTKKKIVKLLQKTKHLSYNIDFKISDKISRIAKQLYRRKDIIIKNADKNLGVTVLDRSFYFEEALSERHLGNVNTYVPLNKLPLSKLLVLSITKILKKYNQYDDCNGKISTFSNDILTNLNNDYVIPSHMYFIPKIHKSPIALRPICASIGSSTYIASKYLDILLQPIMKNIKSFINNSNELVCKLESVKFSPNCHLLEADVENLYPSIEIEDGLESLRKALFHHRWKIADIEFVVELAHWVLTNNFIQFGDRYYLQKVGTAMGTPFAVTFACIHLAIIENETLTILLNNGHREPQLYYRYIDDIIAVFEYPVDAVAFMSVFNTRRRGLHCPKYLVSDSSATFLDLTVYKASRFKSSGKLDVKLFQKPTNKFLFLPTTSFHPEQCAKGWISSYIKRIRLNCSNDVDYEKFKADFYAHLLNRGYKVSIYKLFQVEYDRKKLIDLALEANYKNKTQRNTPISILIKYNPRASMLKQKFQQILKPSNFVLNDNDSEIIFGSTLRPQLTWTNDISLSKLVTRTKLRTDDIPNAYRNYGNDFDSA